MVRRRAAGMPPEPWEGRHSGRDARRAGNRLGDGQGRSGKLLAGSRHNLESSERAFGILSELSDYAVVLTLTNQRSQSPHMPIALSRGNFQVLQRKVGLPRVATPRVGLIYLPEARHACIS